MTERTCANCHHPFFPRQYNARFCSLTCKTAWFAAEAKEAKRQLRAGTTYHDHAIADAEIGAGGRFAANQRSVVNGTAPTVPVPPTAPHWSQEAASLPNEPPLGFAIDEIGEALGGAGGSSHDR